MRSGRYAGDAPGTADPIAARPVNTYETFEVPVPEGTRHSRLEAGVGWQDKRIDLDLSVYRMDSAGRAVAPAVARSASKSSDTERAVYAPPAPPSSPGATSSSSTTSARATPTGTRAAEQPANCGIGATRRPTRTTSRAR